MSSHRQQPAYIFSTDFEPPASLRFPVPRAMGQRLPEIWGAGLYKIYLQQINQEGYDPLDEIQFPHVKSHAEVPQVDAETVAQLILAVVYDHNMKHRRQLKYRCRFMIHQEQGAAKDAYVQFSLNALNTFDDPNPETDASGDPPPAPAVMEPHGGHFGGGGPMDYGDVITDPMMLFMSHLSGLMHEQRLWMHECRIDLREARTHASNAHGKLYDVVTSNLTHTEAQSKINQTGWDALHRGAEMQADQQQRDWGYWQQIQQLNNQIVMLEHQKQQQQSAGPTFMQQLFPLIAMGLMPRMGAMGPMMMGMIKKMMPGMLPEGEEGEEGEEEEEEETLETPEAQPMEPPAAEAPNVSELDRLTLRDIGTPAEVRKSPIRSMCRLLDRMITPDERAQIQRALSPMEWSGLQQVLQGKTDDKCSFALLQLGSQIDDTRQKRLESILRPRPRKLLNDIGSYIQGGFQGKSPQMPASAGVAAPSPPEPTAAPEAAAAPTPRTPSTVYCGGCGQPNPKGFRFCGGCGTSLAPAAAAPGRRRPAPVPTVDSPPAAPPPEEPSETGAEAPPPPPPPPPPEEPSETDEAPEPSETGAEAPPPPEESTEPVPDEQPDEVPEGDNEGDNEGGSSEETDDIPASSDDAGQDKSEDTQPPKKSKPRKSKGKGKGKGKGKD